MDVFYSVEDVITISFIFYDEVDEEEEEEENEEEDEEGEINNPSNLISVAFGLIGRITFYPNKNVIPVHQLLYFPIHLFCNNTWNLMTIFFLFLILLFLLFCGWF